MRCAERGFESRQPGKPATANGYQLGQGNAFATSAWSQENFSVSFGALALAQQIRASQLDDELVEVIRHIHHGRALITRR